MSQSGGNTFNTRLEKDASQGNGSDPSQDVTGSATTPPEENTGMGMSEESFQVGPFFHLAMGKNYLKRGRGGWGEA